jgi:hypothetical protein
MSMTPLLAGIAIVLFLPATAVRAESVSVVETEETFPVTDAQGANPREMKLRQVRMENAWLRADFLPQLGGRLRSVFDKAAGKEMFLVRPIEWTPTLYTCYGSQLGGHELNFPCFHHGNNYRDQWNWSVQRAADGTAHVSMGWTEPLRRQRVVMRWSLRPGDAILRAHYRFINLNPQPLGLAPWSNTFFGYADDLQYIVPAARVSPHGYNDEHLQLMPWAWPEWDDASLCHWRNLTPAYVSFFAVGLEEDFNGVYYTRSDHGMARLFDRTLQPGLKVFTHVPNPDKKPAPTDYTEVWAGPAVSHEDMAWWEAFGVREYEDAFFGVHGIGGYRFAGEAGAVNFARRSNSVEIGVCVTRPVPGAVVALSGVEGDWLRQAVDLSPDKPWRGTVARTPGREPLDLRVWDAGGRCVLRYSHRPDPGLRPEPTFTGSALWKSSPHYAALKAEQFQILWRGPTGGYGDFGEQGARAFRELVRKEASNVEFALGLARSLLTDTQVRQPGQPGVGTAEQTVALAVRNMAEAAKCLEPFAGQDPRAALLLGEVRLRQGDRKAARRCFEAADGDPVAAVELSRLAGADGDAAAAWRHSAVAIRLFPGNNAVAQLHAANLIRAGKQVEAEAWLGVAFALDPVDALTAHLLSLAAADPKARADWAAKARTLLAQTEPPASLEAELERLGWKKKDGEGK